MQVLPQDVDSQYGIAQSPIGPSPSQSPLAFQPFGPAPSGPPTAYTSALARSASASGSVNLSRLSRSPSGSTATATATATTSRGSAAPAVASAAAAEQADAAAGVAVLGGSPRGGDQEPPMGVTPPSEEPASVRVISGGGGEADTLVDDAQATQPRNQPVSFSLAVEPAITSPPSLKSPPALQDAQASDPVQIQEDSGIAAVSSPGTDQLPTDSQDSAQAAGSDAASRAGDDSQAATAPSSTELQQSMKAVLSGEDQAMQASLAAANAAGGEQVKDMLVPSSHLQEGTLLAQAGRPPQADPSLTQASTSSNPSSGSPRLQAAESSPDGSPSVASTPGLSTDVAAGGELTTSRAVGVQEQQPEQAGECGDQQTWVDAETRDGTAARQGDASGQIADKFRWAASVSHVALRRHAQIHLVALHKHVYIEGSSMVCACLSPPCCVAILAYGSFGRHASQGMPCLWQKVVTCCAAGQA